MSIELNERRVSFEASWPSWTPRTLCDHVQHCAEHWPDSPWLVLDGVEWTYGQMADLCVRYAAGFEQRGVRRGDRVGLLLGNSVEFFALFFGLSRIGAVVVPINHLLGSSEIRFVVEHAEPTLFVFDDVISGRDMVPVLDAAGLFDDETDGCTVVYRGAVPDGHTWESLDSYLGDSGVEPTTRGSAPTDTCAIMYTTGSSGRPKGVLLHGDALLREGYGTALTRGYFPAWATVTALPSFHLFVLAQAVIPVTFVGGSVTVQAVFDPRAQLELVGAGRANDLIGVAAMFHRIVDSLQSFDIDEHPDWGLTSVFVGGDVLPEGVWQMFRDELRVDEITAGFGMTEIQGTCFMVPPEASNEALANTVGWPSKAGCAGIADRDGDEHEWRIVDTETGVVVPDGTVGEVQYRGPSVSRGYWKVPADEDSSRVEGWFQSCDLGYVRADGAFVFIGRNSEVFRSGGEMVSPAEVEAVIAQLDEVSAAFVVGVPDERFGHIGCAWVVTAGDVDLAPSRVIDHCRQLARYKVPKHVFAIRGTDVPMSASGKYLRRELVAMANDRIAALQRPS